MHYRSLSLVLLQRLLYAETFCCKRRRGGERGAMYVPPSIVANLMPDPDFCERRLSCFMNGLTPARAALSAYVKYYFKGYKYSITINCLELI